MLREWLGRPKAPSLQARVAAAPLRVLHVGKFYPPYRGGMESFLADLIEQQRASGIDAYAVVHGDPLPDDPPWLIRVPVQITLVFAPIALGFPLALHRAIRAFQPDVLHLHMPNNAAFWALLMPAARRVAWVTHWHSDVLISKWDSLLQLCYQVYKPFETKLLRQSAAILATSPPYMAASIPLQRWLFKTLAIPLGLKPLDQSALVQAQTEGPQLQLWGDARLRVLSVGRLTYYKGFDTLISAVAGFADVQLLIAGEGEQRKDLEALIARERSQQGCANVQLLGQVSEAQKHALFNSCDIFALASRERTEAFGLVLIEAMQHGKPCIASDLDGSGMSWVVGQSGSGQCYAPDQVQAWKEAIRQALAAKAQLAERGLAAQQAADAYFSISQCERRIAEVYDSIQPATESLPIAPQANTPARPLQVAVLQQPAQWPQLQQWQADHPESLLLCVDASGQRDPDPQAQRGLAQVSLRDLDWPDVIALIQRLAEEQTLSALSICSAADLLGQKGLEVPVLQPQGRWQRWLARRGIRHLQLGRAALVLQGDELAAWARAQHASWGRHLFMRSAAQP
ncbi:glycosyltransferase [Comamonas piscis]|uniref:Glycosyltransferase n=1 Tax=Comamonas piscis TaxID=1562974 RepID=A0A7G5ED57_9BURK|nr:glycosyltransferase [Comamonas piscis]QMV71932.1 glycosyltransferase [Comamonas piscis]WSO34673.1 glycosyltransferase [Comamonas piscis]